MDFFTVMLIALFLTGGLLCVSLVAVLWEGQKKREHELALARAKATDEQKVAREKETIVKEVVMTPCKYCGELMPQTAAFCPNCGASQKKS